MSDGEDYQLDRLSVDSGHLFLITLNKNKQNKKIPQNNFFKGK